MSSRYSLSRDLRELERMCERLGDYALGDALYLSIGGGFARSGPIPQLTIGNLLLRRRRLVALRSRLDQASSGRLSAALQEHDQVRSDWRAHYEKKLRRELPARLRLLDAFLADCRNNPRDGAAAYPVEALRRTVMQEILLALDEFGYGAGDAARQVERADAGLRAIMQPRAFIWTPLLEAVYPRASFWWLYGAPDLTC